MQLEYSELLSKLIDLQGSTLVVSFTVGENQAFSFFDAVLVRGHEANGPGLLGHHDESIELEFSNGVILTVDPAQFTSATWQMNDNGETFRIAFRAVVVSLIRGTN